MRVGSICYATRQGLGYLAKWFYDAGVIDEVIVCNYTARGTRPMNLGWYPKGTPVLNPPFRGTEVDRFLESVDCCMFFETCWDWTFPGLCQQRGVKTVLIPMYEWFPRDKPPNTFDAIFAPSLLDRDYFPDSTFLPVPVDGKYWKQRTTARRFLHNAGNVGCREHKGTRQLLEAAKYIKSDATITVRAQDTKELDSIVKNVFRNGVLPKCLNVEPGEIPYEQLWDGYDVLVAPEKYNGLSLPLQEARAAGMLVMTTDRYPVNTWLPCDPLIPTCGENKVSNGGHMIFAESIVNPKDIAVCIDAWYGRDISEYSLSAVDWSRSMSWKTLKPVYMKVLEQLCQSS